MKKMYKKIQMAALMTLLLIPVSAQTIMGDFEDVTLPADTCWNGSDFSGGFYSYGNFYNNNFADWGGGITSWDGFAYSNTIDDSTQSFSNMYSTFAGNNSNGIHALSYLSSDWVTYQVQPTIIRFVAPVYLHTMEITNSTYAALTMLNGDFVSKQFGGVSGDDPDWFKLSIFGFAAGTGLPTDTISFYLADYRFTNNNEDFIIKEWTEINLNTLGIVDSIGFLLSSSDTGAYGMNTPAIFCFDNLSFQILSGIDHQKQTKVLAYPNPADDFVFIEGYRGMISLYDLTGTLILTESDSDHLNLNDIPTGVYVLQTGTERTLLVRK